MIETSSWFVSWLFLLSMQELCVPSLSFDALWNEKFFNWLLSYETKRWTKSFENNESMKTFFCSSPSAHFFSLRVKRARKLWDSFRLFSAGCKMTPTRVKIWKYRSVARSLGSKPSVAGVCDFRLQTTFVLLWLFYISLPPLLQIT